MERPPRRRLTETPVVPIHTIRPPQAAARTVGGLALAEPAPAPAPPPPAPAGVDAPAVPRGGRARRATARRPAHDGWTFVVVPPGVGARPRTLHVSVRRFRVAAWTVVTLAGTGIVCGALLTFLLSVAPTVADESAGVELGLFEDRLIGAPRTEAPAEVDLLSLLAIGPAAATVATPTAKEMETRAERPIGPRVDVARAKAERRRVIAAPSVSGERASRTAAVSAEGLPVIGRITSRFTSSRRHPVLGVVRPHRGLDIAAPTGTPISAPAGGRVIFSGRKFGFGNVVEIDHGHGIITRYAHCRTLKVRRGAQVDAGATIATVGRTGLASGPHLHFEVLVDGRSVDPLKQRVEDLIASRSGAPAAAAPAPTGLFVPGMPAAVLPAPAPVTPGVVGDSTRQAGDDETLNGSTGEQPSVR